MKKKNYLMALLLFLIGTAAMAQVTAVPKVSTATEKHYYTFQNNEDTNHNIVTQNSLIQPFKGSNTDPAARFTFEQVYDKSGQAVEGAYYIKSTRLNAYLSHNGLVAGNAVEYSVTAGETERWAIVRKNPDSDTDLSVAVVSYNTKDNPVVSATGGRMGWNPSGGVGGFICLWYTVPTSNLTSFWQMSEVEIPTADFTPINSLDNFQNGWYQLKTTVVFGAAPVGQYASSVPSGNWIFTLSAKATPATFIHIEKSGDNYTIKSATGRYAKDNVQMSNTTGSATNLNLSFPNAADNTQLRIKGSNSNHVWAGWPASTPFIGSSSGGGTSHCRFQISDANEFVAGNYDVYTVSVTGFNDSQNVPVQCNIADYEGVKTVYNGGVFFFEKGQAVQASDFSVAGDVCNIAVNASAKTITISKNNSIITNAQALAGVTTFGEEMGYLPEVPEALTAAITTANSSQTYANLLSLRNQYNAALSTIPMPEDGKAYYIRNKQQSGDGFLLYRAADGTLGTKAYSDEAKDDASVFVCHRLDNGKYVFVNGQASDYLIWKGQASGSNSYNNNKGFLDRYRGAFCNITLESRVTTQPGTFTIYGLRSNGSDATFVLGTNGALNGWGNSVCWTSSFSNLFMFEEADYHNNVNLRTPATADEHSYASLYLPFAATVPADVEVFTATRENSWLVLNPVEGTLPAGTAVVVRGTEAGEALFVPAIEAGTAVENNVLQGTVAAEATPADTYVLSGAFEAGIGFYPYTAANLPVGKAYLTATDVPFTGESGVKGLLFGNGGTTGIGSAVTDSESGAVYYDLSGRRVLSPAAGIYIRNGKKVFVK